jgi:hypothetical protein
MSHCWAARLNASDSAPTKMRLKAHSSVVFSLAAIVALDQSSQV